MSENIDIPVSIELKTAELEPGSASEPTLKFNNYESTGIYSDAAKEISFSSSGSKIFSVSKDIIECKRGVIISNSDTSFTGNPNSIYLYRKSGNLYLNNGTETKIGASDGTTPIIKLLCAACSYTNVSNLATGAPNTVDGYSLSTNDRVLVIGQNSYSFNGVYVVNTVGSGSNGVWARATDFDDPADLEKGTLVFVKNGTLYGSSLFSLNAKPSFFGMDTIVFTRFMFNNEVVSDFVTGLSGAFNTVNSDQPTYTYKLFKNGSTVSLRFVDTFRNASFNTNLLSNSQLPVELRPSVKQKFIVGGKDDNVDTVCSVDIDTDGTVYIFAGITGTLFSGTGNTGIYATTVSWTI